MFWFCFFLFHQNLYFYICTYKYVNLNSFNNFSFFPRVSQNTEKQFWEWSYKTIFQQNWISLYSTLPNINNIGLTPVLVYQARKWLQLWRKTVHSTCTRKKLMHCISYKTTLCKIHTSSVMLRGGKSTLMMRQRVPCGKGNKYINL